MSSGETTAAPQVVARRLVWVGPLAIAASVVANVILRLIAISIVDVDPEFEPLASPGQSIFLTFAGTLGAVIVYAVITSLSARPIRTFRWIAGAALLVSWLPAVGLLTTDMYPGANVQTVGTLMLMHLVAASVSVFILTTLTRSK